MRVALSMDMEGVSQLSDWREILAACGAYWRTGTARMTADTVAAAEGLLAGGATEVVVLDNHGSGNPRNIDAGALPHATRVERWDAFELGDHGVDAMLQVGYHARCGVAGFLSHTYLPRLRLRVDEELISESHGRAWAAGVPLIGIVGTDAHERTLGSLSGTPFLAVQRSDAHDRVVPVYGTDAESADAIRSFATGAARAVADVAPAEPPVDTVFEASLPVEADQIAVLEAAGLRQTSDTAFKIEIRSWAGAREPLRALMTAAWQPWLPYFDGLDLTSPEAFSAQDPERLEALEDAFAPWVSDAEPEWL